MDDSEQIIIYQPKGSLPRLEIKLRDETVWLSLNQIAELFDRDKSVVSRHLRNIYGTKELDWNSTVAKNATVQMENGRSIERQIEYYNLDAILSVGYRVNSKRGTQFRIWATRVLKDHILKGYTVNEKRLKEQAARFKELQETVALMGRLMVDRKLAGGEAEGLLKVA